MGKHTLYDKWYRITGEVKSRYAEYPEFWLVMSYEIHIQIRHCEICNVVLLCYKAQKNLEQLIRSFAQDTTRSGFEAAILRQLLSESLNDHGYVQSIVSAKIVSTNPSPLDTMLGQWASSIVYHAEKAAREFETNQQWRYENEPRIISKRIVSKEPDIQRSLHGFAIKTEETWYDPLSGRSWLEYENSFEVDEEYYAD